MRKSIILLFYFFGFTVVTIRSNGLFQKGNRIQEGQKVS
jgi:hypothetical protein